MPSSGRSRACTSPTRTSAFPMPCRSSSARVSSAASSVASIATTSRTRRARSAVMVPGPEPTSSRRSAGRRCGSRYAALFEAVRARCDFSTLSAWPWVYVIDRIAASAVDPDAGRRVRDQVVEPKVEHPAEGHQRGQSRVQRRPRSGLALLELLVRVRRDPGQVRGPLLAEATLLARTLEAEPDVTTELLPGRLCSSYGHGPIVPARPDWQDHLGMVIPRLESAGCGQRRVRGRC